MENKDYKDVVVKIVDRHEDGEFGNAGECSELITTGRFCGDSSSFSLSYLEQDDELKSCVTTLNVDGSQRVQMTRTGKYTAEMIMERNKRHSCQYRTPYGEFIMGVYASSIDSSIEERRGRLRFKYTVDFNSTNSVENELSIYFKEADDDVAFD